MSFRVLTLLLCLLPLLSVPVSSTSLNLHLKLDPLAEGFATQIADTVRSGLPNDIINFHTTFQPHITLYLTDFSNNTAAVVQTFKRLAPRLRALSTELTSFTANGTYAFWMVENTAALQKMSDVVVNATSKYALQNQTIPDWVNQLPEPLRSLKIEYIQKYGSPNVFQQFVPHVTIAYDEVESVSALASSIASLPPAPRSTNLSVLGVGTVGPAGSVVRGQDYADFKLAVKGEKKVRKFGRGGRIYTV